MFFSLNSPSDIKDLHVAWELLPSIKAFSSSWGLDQQIMKFS